MILLPRVSLVQFHSFVQPDLLAREQSMLLVGREYDEDDRNFPFCYLFLSRANFVCSNVIPPTRLHFFIRIGLQLGLLQTAVRGGVTQRGRTPILVAEMQARYATKKATTQNNPSPRTSPVRLQAGGASLLLVT